MIFAPRTGLGGLMSQKILMAGRDAMAGESLISTTRSPIARCDQCKRFAVPGQFLCTKHLTPKLARHP